MPININKLFSTKGRATRREFLITFSIISIFWLGLLYLLQKQVNPVTNLDTYYLSKMTFQVVSLISVTPIMLRRIHDIHLPGYTLSIFYITIPFSFSNLIYLQHSFNLESIDVSWLTSWPILILYGLHFFVLIILFFYKSYPEPNSWGSPHNKLSTPFSQEAVP